MGVMEASLGAVYDFVKQYGGLWRRRWISLVWGIGWPREDSIEVKLDGGGLGSVDIAVPLANFEHAKAW